MSKKYLPLPTICLFAVEQPIGKYRRYQPIQEYLKKAGIRPLGVEGETNGQWILLDYDDVVISIFQESLRAFYAIEDLWNAPRMNVAENTTEV